MTPPIRALGLLSGGLDSMLAARLLQSQGLEVAGICFITPFYGAGRARRAALHLGMPLLEVDFTEKFLTLLYDPPHGFGKGHNPCLDCHILMLREAGAVMQSQGFDFLFTGEVLGQRPMSQHRGALTLVAREAGFPDLILRPLSARLLKPTQPELLGWVDRERLLDLSGRGRKRQIALARELGITDYPSPAGGCLLTDPGYAARLKELLRHTPQATRQELELLKWGRHFRGHTIAGEAGDGEEGIAKYYKELKPDLVTMDIVMPKLNGIESLKAIKEFDPAAKVVMCTAVGQEQMVKLAIKSGAKGYIIKPFQAPKVLEEVKNVLAS